MVLNARVVLFMVFFILMLAVIFVWAESIAQSAPPAASPPGAPAADPLMQQAQKNLFTMHELMHKIQSTQDADKRRELVQEHMQIMQEQLRMMQGMIQGICGMGPIGKDEDDEGPKLQSVRHAISKPMKSQPGC